MIEQLAQRDVMALQPEAAALGIAHRDMAEDAVAVAVELEDAPGLGKLIELLTETRADHLDIASLVHFIPSHYLCRHCEEGISPTKQSRETPGRIPGLPRFARNDVITQPSLY